jgi:uncharacterized protein (TIGR02246 family)
MLPHKPDEWPALLEKHIAAGDLDAAAVLYASDASFVSPKSGEVIKGRDAIRAVLCGLIKGKARLRGRVVKTVIAGDVAVLYTEWQITTADGEEHSRAIEVLRRQTDGTWLLAVGDPHGRN